MSDGKVRILHTNDLHGSLDDARCRALMDQRHDVDLYFDTGDCIKTGNLGIPLKPEPVWPRLAKLDCSASVPGNRESHLLRSALDAKVAGHQHPILCANLYDRDGERIFPASLELEVEGLRVGVFGVMVPMVTERMATQSLSQMLWTAPIPEAIEMAANLRANCDLVIGLTHIGFQQDQLLADATPNIDLILGGHSHTILESPLRVNQCWICQGGSHGRFFGRYEWSFGMGLVSSQLVPWVA
jgi:5'-nucleotidase